MLRDKRSDAKREGLTKVQKGGHSKAGCWERWHQSWDTNERRQRAIKANTARFHAKTQSETSETVLGTMKYSRVVYLSEKRQTRKTKHGSTERKEVCRQLAPSSVYFKACTRYERKDPRPDSIRVRG